MDKILYDRGLAERRQVLGDSYVDRALANVNDFNREFQRLVTEYCWGEVWGEDTLSPRERSILTLGMVAALGKMGEFANHVRGAQANGLTPNELRAVLTQIAVYCGIPVGADCFQVAGDILGERGTMSANAQSDDPDTGSALEGNYDAIEDAVSPLDYTSKRAKQAR
jgi:4-carboxymuconolactone decarboxylase